MENIQDNNLIDKVQEVGFSLNADQIEVLQMLYNLRGEFQVEFKKLPPRFQAANMYLYHKIMDNLLEIEDNWQEQAINKFKRDLKSKCFLESVGIKSPN